jgi:hypothetical protein
VSFDVVSTFPKRMLWISRESRVRVAPLGPRNVICDPFFETSAPWYWLPSVIVTVAGLSLGAAASGLTSLTGLCAVSTCFLLHACVARSPAIRTNKVITFPINAFLPLGGGRSQFISPKTLGVRPHQKPLVQQRISWPKFFSLTRTTVPGERTRPTCASLGGGSKLYGAVDSAGATNDFV